MDCDCELFDLQAFEAFQALEVKAFEIALQLSTKFPQAFELFVFEPLCHKYHPI